MDTRVTQRTSCNSIHSDMSTYPVSPKYEYRSMVLHSDACMTPSEKKIIIHVYCVLRKTGDTVGSLLGKPERESLELSIHPHYRRGGIASKLFQLYVSLVECITPLTTLLFLVAVDNYEGILFCESLDVGLSLTSTGRACVAVKILAPLICSCHRKGSLFQRLPYETSPSLLGHIVQVKGKESALPVTSTRQL